MLHIKGRLKPDGECLINKKVTRHFMLDASTVGSHQFESSDRCRCLHNFKRFRAPHHYGVGVYYPTFYRYLAVFLVQSGGGELNTETEGCVKRHCN